MTHATRRIASTCTLLKSLIKFQKLQDIANLVQTATKTKKINHANMFIRKPSSNSKSGLNKSKNESPPKMKNVKQKRWFNHKTLEETNQQKTKVSSSNKRKINIQYIKLQLEMMKKKRFQRISRKRKGRDPRNKRMTIKTKRWKRWKKLKVRMKIIKRRSKRIKKKKMWKQMKLKFKNMTNFVRNVEMAYN